MQRQRAALLRGGEKEKRWHFDTYFLGVVLTISTFGVLMFVSAALGIFARDKSIFYGILFNQIVLGFLGGLLLLWLMMRIPYPFWRRHAFILFLSTVILTLLVFVPQIGLKHGGAQRWISIGPVSFQPAEFLKLGFIIYLATWLAWVRKKGEEVKHKIVPLIVMLAIAGGALLKQPDTKSLVLIIISSAAMLFVSGVSWKRIVAVLAVGVGAFVLLAFLRPYVMDRIQTFINPSLDPQGTSYQLRQSLIAVGSGGITGRGLGQSVQKFSYLPEPQGDSIFAVIAEEFGFIGSTIVVILYVFLAIRGYKIAASAPDSFGRYLVTGLVTLIVAQSFLNIASLVGLFPLTGVPLVFISHGGTSLAIALASVGIILNVSTYRKNS